MGVRFNHEGRYCSGAVRDRVAERIWQSHFTEGLTITFLRKENLRVRKGDHPPRNTAGNRRNNRYCPRGHFAKTQIMLSRKNANSNVYVKSRVGGSDPPTLNFTYVRQILYLLNSPLVPFPVPPIEKKKYRQLSCLFVFSTSATFFKNLLGTLSRAIQGRVFWSV